MANNVKYLNEVGGVSSSIAGERISTNGYYTGEKKGTPTQGYGETIGAHDVEEGTIRLGTMLQDYLGMPKTAVGFKQTLTLCTSAVADGKVSNVDNLSVVYTAAEEASLPSTITVKIGGKTATVSTDYTWTVGTGTLAIAKAKLVGDVEVTVTATANTSS